LSARTHATRREERRETESISLSSSPPQVREQRLLAARRRLAEATSLQEILELQRAHDNGLDSVTFGVVASNPIRAASIGFTWKTPTGNELHMGYARMTGENYGGPSALFPGARESVKPYVNAINVAWSRPL